jgi:hypothetical protein
MSPYFKVDLVFLLCIMVWVLFNGDVEPWVLLAELVIRPVSIEIISLDTLASTYVLAVSVCGQVDSIDLLCSSFISFV